MQETLVRSLGWEDLLDKEMAVFLPGKFHGQRSLAGYSPWGHQELDVTMTEQRIQLSFYLRHGKGKFYSTPKSLLNITIFSALYEIEKERK